MSEPVSYLLESDTEAGELVSRYPHVTNALLAPWAITEEMKDVVAAIAARRLAGQKLSPDEIAEATDGREAHREAYLIPFSIAAAADGSPRAAGRSSRAPTTGQIAVLPLYGVMAPRLGLIGQMSGGSSVESFMRNFKGAVADPQVSAILIDIDSPGGSTGLIAELGDLIFDARGEKPIAAIANTMAGSAAYWVAAQVDELACTPSGTVGSIGVYGMHADISRSLEKAGVDVTVISAGKFKTELQPYGPLSDDARAYGQEQVDAHHTMFKKAVARGRGTTVADVAANFGQGRMLMADKAKAARMVDVVATFDQMVERLARGQVVAGKPSRPRPAAATDRLELAATDADEPMVDTCPDCAPHDAHDGPCPVDGCDCTTYEEGAGPHDDTASAVTLEELLAGSTLEALEPGSTLVLNLDRGLTDKQADELRERVAAALEAGDHQLIVVDANAGSLRKVVPHGVIGAPGVSGTIGAHGTSGATGADAPEDSPATAGESAGDSLLRRRAVRTAISQRPEGGNE